MSNLNPICSSTIVDTTKEKWTPSSFKNLLTEIKNITCYHKKHHAEPALLYRGQIDSNWKIECTFLRNIRKKSLSMMCKLPPGTFHIFAYDELVQKYNSFNHSSEVLEREKSNPKFDKLFELMKHHQQHPEKDYYPIKGTFLVDWSREIDVSLYFSLYDGFGSRRHIYEKTSSLYIYNATLLKNSYLGDIKLNSIFQKQYNKRPHHKQLPLMTHPSSQTNIQRASGQKPVYICHIDFSKPQCNVLVSHGKKIHKPVLIKIIIKNEIKLELENYLKKKGITEQYIYPN